tara:strand:- start:420 stop:716 length:297 start_codon:yes stop_codon:yes gene_type:complete
VHKSELEIFIVGVIAEGGGDFKVVSDFEVISLRVVESVIIVSPASVSTACANKTLGNTKSKNIKNSFMLKNLRKNYYFIKDHYTNTKQKCQELFLLCY